MSSSSIAKAVISGNKIKFTLEQVEQLNTQLVRVDWLRFTIPVDSLLPRVSPEWCGDLEKVVSLSATDLTWTEFRGLVPQRLAVETLKVCDSEYYLTPRALAFLGAFELTGVLKGDHGMSLFPINVAPEVSGMDYYAARQPVMYEGSVVGYVLAGGKQQSQAGTVHFNLFGSACLHLGPKQLAALADWIDSMGGWITRCDLSLDVWQGLDLTSVQQAWRDGCFDVRGKRPSQREHGSWSSGHSRTFEVGSRGTGKLMRAYEKGDELFGHEANDPWVRLEVEFRNSHRIIDIDVLRRPADFFAGAYPYCADFLRDLNLGAEVCHIPTHAEVKDKTAEAAVTRVVRWITNTAAPALSAVWNLGGDMVAEVIEKNQHRQARRLAGFSPADIQAAFHQVARAIAPPAAPFAFGAGA